MIQKLFLGIKNIKFNFSNFHAAILLSWNFGTSCIHIFFQETYFWNWENRQCLQRANLTTNWSILYVYQKIRCLLSAHLFLLPILKRLHRIGMPCKIPARVDSKFEMKGDMCAYCYDVVINHIVDTRSVYLAFAS